MFNILDRLNKSHVLFIFFCSILLGEMLLVSLMVDAQTVQGVGVISWLMHSMGYVLRWLIIFLTTASLMLYLVNREELAILINSVNPIKLIPVCVHSLTAAIFIYFTNQLFSLGSSPESLEFTSWMSSAASVFISWLWMSFNVHNIKAVLIRNRKILIFASFAALFVFLIIVNSRILWAPLSQFTLDGAAVILNLIFSDIFIDYEYKLLGLRDFVVEISPQCSGLEGLVIALSVTLIYLYLLKDKLRFPLAFLLIPIAAVVAICFNVLRVAILVMIGGLYSPDLAIGGFHSIAGWLFAVLTAFLIIFVFANYLVFEKPTDKDAANVTPVDDQFEQDSLLASAILIPFVMLLLISLINSMFSVGFDYLYPAKPIIVGLLLVFFWKHYPISLNFKKLEPIAAGVLVAVLWALTVEPNPTYDESFVGSIGAMSAGMMALWIITRILGFLVIAPIVEELVFRGYIMSRISRLTIQTSAPDKLSWIAIGVSSIAFGVMHNAIIAGTIAGLIFALVRIRQNNLAAPITAHFVANLCVAIWAFITGQWVLV